jgi:hypothetical protein
MVEYWNTGTMGYGIMRYWENGNICRSHAAKMDNIISNPVFHLSNIP